MVRWNLALLKVSLALGAFAALMIASGAGWRWD
jgi:hypothetical protein